MIKRILDKLPHFLREAHSEENGLASSRRLQMSAVVSAAILFVAYDVVAHRGLRAESIDLTKFIAALVGAYVGITRIAGN
jgi:hypothetical protein